jgi:hypothetical protein
VNEKTGRRILVAADEIARRFFPPPRGLNNLDIKKVDFAVSTGRSQGMILPDLDLKMSALLANLKRNHSGAFDGTGVFIALKPAALPPGDARVFGSKAPHIQERASPSPAW